MEKRTYGFPDTATDPRQATDKPRHTIFLVGNAGIAPYFLKYFKDHNIHHLTRENAPLENCTETGLKNHIGALIRFNMNLCRGAYIVNVERATDHEQADTVKMAMLNTVLPLTLERVAKFYGMKMIHLSTNCVFAGRPNGHYQEWDSPDALDHYGRTRAIGEPSEALVLRTSTIGEHTELFGWLKGSGSTQIQGFDRVMWNGLTCLEACIEIERAMNDLLGCGIVHLFDQTVSKYELLHTLADVYLFPSQINCNSNRVEDRTLSSTFLSGHTWSGSLKERIERQKKWLAE